MVVVPVARVTDHRLGPIDLRVAVWLVVLIDRGGGPVDLADLVADLDLDVADVRDALGVLRRVGVLHLLDLTDPHNVTIGFDFAEWEAR